MPPIIPKSTLFEGKYLRLIQQGRWEFVERTKVTGIAVILAVTSDQKLLLVEQFRMPVNSRMIELPAGLAGDDIEGEALATAAKRELLEETGYAAGTMVPILHGPSSAGLTSEILTLFRAGELRKVGPALGDGHEDITVHEVPIPELKEWLNRKAIEGCLIDFKLHTGLYFL